MLKFKKNLYLVKILICLIPLFFCFIVFFTGNIDYQGMFETKKYTSVALHWMDDYTKKKIEPTRLPGYPAIIYIVFKIFGANNLTALLFVQSIIGCFTFYFIIKILEELKIDDSFLILSTLAFNFAIIFRFSLFLPNFFFIFILTLAIFFFTKFYFKQKFYYFFLFCFFFSSLCLVRPIIHFSIYITYPLIILYLIRLNEKFSFKLACIITLLAFYFLSIGTQFLRSFNYDKSFVYSSQSGVHFFWVISCLSKKYACGNRDMKVFENLESKVEKQVSSLENPNLGEINKIRIKVGKEYLMSEMELERLVFAAFISYLKLIFHSTFIEIFSAFEMNVSPLYSSGENNFYGKLNNIVSNSLTNKLNGVYLISVLLIIVLRFLQLYGFYISIKSSHLRMYGLIITSIVIIVLATGIGLGNPRYRSEAEPLLIILGGIGIKKIIDKLKN